MKYIILALLLTSTLCSANGQFDGCIAGVNKAISDYQSGVPVTTILVELTTTGATCYSEYQSFTPSAACTQAFTEGSAQIKTIISQVVAGSTSVTDALTQIQGIVTNFAQVCNQ